MGFADVDKKAIEKYTPSKFLKKLAEKHNVNISAAKSEEEARRLIDTKRDTKPGVTPAKDGEVLPPLRNGNGYDRNAHFPQFVVNVPSINAHVDVNSAPAWHEMVGVVKDAVLWMVLGAALITVARGVLGL